MLKNKSVFLVGGLVVAALGLFIVPSLFLSVWSKSLERSGYTLKMTVDGAETTDSGFVMKDKQQIVLNYTTLAAEPE